MSSCCSHGNCTETGAAGAHSLEMDAMLLNIQPGTIQEFMHRQQQGKSQQQQCLAQQQQGSASISIYTHAGQVGVTNAALKEGNANASGKENIPAAVLPGSLMHHG